LSAVLVLRGLVALGDDGFSVGPVDLELHAGQAMALLGRAGAGKSLLLSALVGLAPLVEGSAQVAGVPLERGRLKELRRKVGFCFQRDALLGEATALENVRLAVRARDLDDEEGRARRALDAVGLLAAAHKAVPELSGGMKKRLGLARALACEPALLLGDDVTAGLDPSTSAAVLDRLLTRVRAGEAAALLSTHDVDALLPRVDTALVLDGGRVVYRGAPKGLAAVPELAPFVARRAA
jgi:ABC-type multidrug transport system ATPase subunit